MGSEGFYKDAWKRRGERAEARVKVLEAERAVLACALRQVLDIVISRYGDELQVTEEVRTLLARVDGGGK